MSLTDSDRRTVTIRRPTAPAPPDVAAPAFSVDGPIAGLRVGLRTDRAWRSWMLIARDWEERLTREGAHPVQIETGTYIGDEGSQDRKNVSEWADGIDCALVGLGTCGSCTSYSVADAVVVEDRSRPAVVVVTTEFEVHAHNMARFLGHGDLKVLVLPYPLEARPEAELLQIAEDYYPAALSLLGATR